MQKEHTKRETLYYIKKDSNGDPVLKDGKPVMKRVRTRKRILC